MARFPVIDLTEDTAFTLALLDNTWAWRQRLVEQVQVSELRARVRSSYQVELPPLTVAPFLDRRDAEAVKVLLPLTTKPKRLLSGFDLQGPDGGPAHLLPRRSIAAIEAEYVAVAARSSPSADAAELLDLDVVTALCVFTPGLVRELDSTRRPDEGRYREFLESGLGIEVPLADLRRWRAAEEELADLIVGALDEPRDWLSSAEHICLALPFLEQPPPSLRAVDERLERFSAFVRALHRAGDVYLLALLGEYGRRWETIIETQLPLNEPATIRMAEDRPMKLSPWGWCRHPVSFGDAISYHAEITLDDASLEFVGESSVLDLAGEEIGRPPVEGVLFARRAVAIYSSHPERPYYGEIRFRLRPSSDLRYATRGVVLLLVPALVVGLLLDPGGDDASVVGEMGVVAIATTLAVALLLVREATPMAAHLLRTSRAAVLVGMLLIWAVVLLRIAGWSGL